jgi:hypothetical protein
MALDSGLFYIFFYQGLEQSSKIDVAARGNLMNIGVRDAYKLIDEMTLRQQ